jgi:hypothetical protein
VEAGHGVVQPVHELVGDGVGGGGHEEHWDANGAPGVAARLSDWWRARG